MSARVKLTALVVLLTLLPAGIMLGQSADRIDTILESPVLSIGDAAYLATLSAGVIDPQQDAAAAVGMLRALAAGAEHRDRYADRDLESDATLGDFSYMLMLSHDLSGGFWYGFFPGPRYALREMRWRRIVAGQNYALQPLDGERALRMITRILETMEDRG
ncbi:MAG: hypothetical protein GVY14_01580 [Spirochaetes bacterium]|nr:hypothetical protein [Spirochaetota bacterium]